MIVDAGQFLAGSVLPAIIACPPRRVAGHPQGRNEVEEPRLRGLTRHPPRWLSPVASPAKPWGGVSPRAPRAGEDDETWRRIDCSRISGLCVETPISGPPWKSHTAGHTWCRRRAPGLLSAWRGVGRFEAPCRRQALSSCGGRLITRRRRRPGSRRPTRSEPVCWLPRA